MAQIKLYTNPMSRGRTARWMLEEIGQPYEAVMLNFGPEMQTPEYRALNPMRKVPTLVHGDVVVTELPAVLTYLADAFPQAGLAPAIGAAERGPYLRWMFFGAGPLEYAVTFRSLGLDPPAERSGLVGFGSYDRTLDALAQALTGRDYLSGAKFTAADLYVGAQLGFGLRFKTIAPRPEFESYVARVHDRPAARQAAALDDAAMPPKKA